MNSKLFPSLVPRPHPTKLKAIRAGVGFGSGTETNFSPICSKFKLLCYSLFKHTFVRRFVWNFFRLENEHLNNCGQFRVVRDISIQPLNIEGGGDGGEEGGGEGGERGRNRSIREQRRMSTILTEVRREGLGEGGEG